MEYEGPLKAASFIPLKTKSMLEIFTKILIKVMKHKSRYLNVAEDFVSDEQLSPLGS